MIGGRKWVIYTLLDDMGFSLAQLARAIGYPHAALRAFRSGALDTDQTTFEDIRHKLHDIATMTARLGRHRGKTGGNHEEAALFEITLVEGYTASGWDLYTPGDGDRCRRDTRGEPHGGHNGLCALALGEPAEQVLDRFLPDWRTKFWTDHETFLAEDGHRSIRPKRP